MQPRTAPQRIPSLDGLRAISIGLVFFAHLAGTASFGLSTDLVNGWIEFGRLGVRVFFVISGFLITTLLMRELESTGRVDLVGFYLRRTFRIFPAYYTYLGCIAAATALGAIRLNSGDLASALTYTVNYAPHRSWWVGHAWSLSVEEQFYLLWPALLLVAGLRRGLWAAALFALSTSFVRVALYAAPHGALHWFATRGGNSFETVGDAIAVGCLLAGTREWLWQRPRWQAFLTSRWFVLVPAAVVATGLTNSPHVYGPLGHRILFLGFFHFAGIPLMNLGIATSIESCIRRSDSRIGRILDSRPLVFVGVLSYSLYLWQEPFLNRAVASPATRFPANLALAFASAVTSYYLVERPFLRVRPRVTHWLASRRQAVRLDPVATAE